MAIDVREIVSDVKKYMNSEVILQGWVRNHRKQKEFGFIDFSDGTCFGTIQLVYDNSLENFIDIGKIKVGSSLEVVGMVIESQGAGQEFEIKVKNITLVGDCPDEYPIQPKRHTREFLREQAYLRPRTILFSAVFRVRSVAAYAIHKYFQERNYV